VFVVKVKLSLGFIDQALHHEDAWENGSIEQPRHYFRMTDQPHALPALTSEREANAHFVGGKMDHRTDPGKVDRKITLALTELENGNKEEVIPVPLLTCLSVYISDLRNYSTCFGYIW
jgi:hypothetical protein